MHDRILHRHLQPLALAGAGAVEQRADDAERHQHAGSGVADRRAGLDRSPARLAGDAHRAAGGLGDRVERKTALIGTAGAEALYLGIDDAGVDRADDVVAEPQPLDRAGREVLGEDVGLLHHLLDQSQAALGLQVDGERPLVGIVHHEVVGIAEAGAAGLAARRLDLGDVGAHPGERFGAGRARLELRQIKHADPGKAAGRCGRYGHVGLLRWDHPRVLPSSLSSFSHKREAKGDGDTRLPPGPSLCIVGAPTSYSRSGRHGDFEED